MSTDSAGIILFIYVFLLFIFFNADILIFLNCELLINVVLICLFLYISVLLISCNLKNIFFRYSSLFEGDFILNQLLLVYHYRKFIGIICIDKIDYINLLYRLYMYISIWSYKISAVIVKLMALNIYRYICTRLRIAYSLLISATNMSLGRFFILSFCKMTRIFRYSN